MVRQVVQRAFHRRRELLAWLRERDEHQDLMATEIADVSGIYDHIGHGRTDRCFDDLVALERQGCVERSGRPSEWRAVA